MNEQLAEIAIRCPVCGKPFTFVQGGIEITNQLRFVCDSPKCQGKNRYIKSDLLKIIVDKSNNIRL